MREAFLTRSRRQLASGQKWRSARWGRETLWGLKDPTTSSPWWLGARSSCTRRTTVQPSSPMSKSTLQVAGILPRQAPLEDSRLKLNRQVNQLVVMKTWRYANWKLMFLKGVHNLILFSVHDGSSSSATQPISSTRYCFPSCKVIKDPTCCYNPRCYQRKKTICDWFSYTEGKLRSEGCKTDRDI